MKSIDQDTKLAILAFAAIVLMILLCNLIALPVQGVSLAQIRSPLATPQLTPPFRPTPTPGYNEWHISPLATPEAQHGEGHEIRRDDDEKIPRLVMHWHRRGEKRGR